MDTMNNKYRPINPDFACKVFVLPIGKLFKGKPLFEKTRKYWKIPEEYQDTSLYEFAVGVEKGVSVSAYRLKCWCPTKKEEYLGRYEFDGTEFGGFKCFSWKKQTKTAGGYWNFGNPLVVEFDGKGKFRLLRPEKLEWVDCVD